MPFDSDFAEVVLNFTQLLKDQLLIVTSTGTTTPLLPELLPEKAIRLRREIPAMKGESLIREVPPKTPMARRLTSTPIFLGIPRRKHFPKPQARAFRS